MSGRFVCPWCGASFFRRHVVDGIRSLEEHWQQHPDCLRNRNVNDPTMSKNEPWDPETGLRLRVMPGAETLRRVREHEGSV